MKSLLVITAISIVVMSIQGCSNSADGDPALRDKAAPAAPGASAPQPNFNKKLPGAAGSTSMGGAPAAGPMSKPAAKPAGQ